MYKKGDAITMYKSQKNRPCKLMATWLVLTTLLFAIISAEKSAIYADSEALFFPEMLEFTHTREDVLPSWEDKDADELDLWELT